MQVLFDKIFPGVHNLHLFKIKIENNLIGIICYSVSWLLAVKQLTHRSDPPEFVFVTRIS